MRLDPYSASREQIDRNGTGLVDVDSQEIPGLFLGTPNLLGLKIVHLALQQVMVALCKRKQKLELYLTTLLQFHGLCSRLRP